MAPSRHRYGNAPPAMCFVERKTHRESWKGEESVKERFILPEDKMVPFLDGESCSRAETVQLSGVYRSTRGVSRWRPS